MQGTKTYGKQEIKEELVDAKLIKQISLDVRGKKLVDLLSDQRVRFVSEKAVYVASLVPTERKMTYLQVDNSQLRASQVFSVVELVANGYDLFDNGEGVIAVAFSSEGGKMTLTLLKTAINEVGGQRLNSNPVSEIKYRRSGNRKLIDLMEVEVV